MTNTTQQSTLTKALMASVNVGSPIVLNVMSCCRGCVTKQDIQKAYDTQVREFGLPPFAFDDDASTAVWHFGGQGAAIRLSDTGNVSQADEYECSCVQVDDEWDRDEDGNEFLVHEGWFDECRFCQEGPSFRPVREPASVYLNHSSNSAAQTACSALRDAGMIVQWSGSDAQAIEVVI